jgi:twitching motility protein PilT
MSAAGTAPILVTLEGSSGSSATQALLEAMLRASQQVSDLIFSPGRLPQVEVHGRLIPVQGPEVRILSADDTRRIASDLIGNNKQAITILREQGSCDISFALPGLARFRVNIFIQRGSCAVVMRVIPGKIPSFESLRLPPQLRDVALLSDGIVLVTGPRGSGKSSTLASLLDLINEQQTCHIITIEDPIEFLHTHKRATVHQRELHSDAPSMELALRAAMRQAPKVIVVGDMRTRDTVEMVLEAAETGHLVLSSLNTTNAIKAVDRMVGSFEAGEQRSIRSRFSKTFRYVISQRLIPRIDTQGRVSAVEILKATHQTRQLLESDEQAGALLRQTMESGEGEGMQTLDAEIAKLVRAGMVDLETALSFASDSEALRRTLASQDR